MSLLYHKQNQELSSGVRLIQDVKCKQLTDEIYSRQGSGIFCR